ncbi:hypothetical protein [Adhaeretor mobilis]|uniref:Uncharacterized protein n=1 Tax=Adhaeretor mobilis TaxID=1930276 RepID=A0A517N1U7_9BACT|nr:hypothetical protein [Adhaeretor mobilis]QDT01112.1 hypothetical protein HG15A2_44540 [Adhaeretor mobilis]
MSNSANTSSQQQIVPQSSFQEDRLDFIAWALACVKIDARRVGEQLTIELPEADQSSFGGQRTVTVTRTADERFTEWLTVKIAAKEKPLHARPGKQPLSVNDLVAPLFDAYTVDGGQIHLGGCQLTDHPFLRLTFPVDAKTVCHVFVAPDGSTVEDELARELGLDETSPVTDLPPRIDEMAFQTLRGAGLRIAAKASSSRDPEATVVDPLAAAVVWIRHADGQLEFTIGDSSATHHFSSWARLLAPQPYVTRFSGTSTFHLAATDDGRIDAADQIATCEHSGRRVLAEDLIECAVTGQRVLPEFTEVCPVTGRASLRGEFVTCATCQQRVSKASLVNRAAPELKCLACSQLHKVGKEDPRLVWIFGEHPGLDRWGRWQLAETESAYIAQGSSLTKRILVVIDKETLDVRRLASAGILSPGWTDVSEPAQEELLR